MKRDHLGFFINVELLAWMDSPFCVEYNGKIFKRKGCMTTGQVMINFGYWVHSFNFWKIAIKDL